MFMNVTPPPTHSYACCLLRYTSLYQSLQPPSPARPAPQVVSVAATFVEVWEEVGALLGELDVLLAFAEAACVAPTPYVR